MSKKVLLTGCALVLCLLIAASLFLLAKRSGSVYQEVEATVLSSQQSYRRDGDARRAVSLVRVEHEGRQYDLRGPVDYQDYLPGETITAYLAGARMYADPASITPEPALVIAYFASLAAAFLAAALFLVSLALPCRKEEEAS